MGGLAALVACLTWRSLPWPLIHDAPIMHDVATRIAAGDVPYRDLFDMNMPGVCLLHLALVQTLGTGDVAWRVFDLAWLAAGAVAIAALAAPWGRPAAAGGALFFAAYHLAGGAWQAGQRDVLLCPFLLVGALGAARWAEDGSRRRRAVSVAASGLALGAAMSIKPHAAIFAGALLVFIAVVAGRAAVGAAAIFAAGVAVVPAALVLWLAAAGGLAAWTDIVVRYLLPVYSTIGRPALWAVHRWHVWIPLALAVALSLTSAAWARRLGPRHAVAVLGLAYGLAHYVGQGKGWEYHLYPLAAFAAVLAFCELEALLAARRLLLGAPLALSLAAAAVLLGVKGVEASPAAWSWDKEGVVRQLERDLRLRVAPGDRVQVLDTAEGGVHALLRLQARQPTRFLYDFPLFTADRAPITAALRREFIRDIDARPPRFIALFERGWPAGGHDRVDRFPELRARLAARYELVEWRPAFKLYGRRPRP
ncbi:MAG: hypothetical protein WED01_15190 [Candidatus Rokuibacteriota bacterium]